MCSGAERLTPTEAGVTPHLALELFKLLYKKDL